MWCGCVFVFFFKQKTAYEIGTGDWSSDVCSSDLVISYFQANHKKVFEQTEVEFSWQVDGAEKVFFVEGIKITDVTTQSSFQTKVLTEIGRASCRERV